MPKANSPLRGRTSLWGLHPWVGSWVGSFPSLPALAGSEPGFVLLSERAVPELTGREDEVYPYHF